MRLGATYRRVVPVDRRGCYRVRVIDFGWDVAPGSPQRVRGFIAEVLGKRAPTGEIEFIPELEVGAWEEV